MMLVQHDASIECQVQVTEVAREDPLQLSRNTVQEQTAVVAFTALYYSGLPFQVLAALPMPLNTPLMDPVLFMLNHQI